MSLSTTPTTTPTTTTSTETRVFGQLPPPGDVQDGNKYGLNDVNDAKVEMFNKINAQLSAFGNGNAAGDLSNGKAKYNGDVAVIDIVDGGKWPKYYEFTY